MELLRRQSDRIRSISERSVARVSTAMVLLLAAEVALVGCRKSGSTGPEPAVARSLSAQAELREIEEAWAVSSQVARKELGPRLESFVRRNATDPSVARARVMLGQIALADRRYEAAEALLSPVVAGPPSASRDEALVVLAAVDNRRGNHEAALSRLEPLEGKLLSREARDQYARERTSAAMAARRWRLTVDAMTTWLADSEGDPKHVKEWVETAVVQVPPRALSRLLVDWQKTQGATKERRAREWLHRVIIEHLARVALRTRDAQLATELLDHSPPWLRAGDSGDELSMLSSLAQKEAQILGRAVGVVLGGTTADEKRRSVRLALGLMRGLGPPDGRAPIQLLTVEDRGSTTSALSMLSSLGASILVAGLNQNSSAEALKFAESRKVPVVAIEAPTGEVTGRYAFVFGASTSAQEEAARRALPDITKWVLVGTTEEPCEGPVARPETISLPIPRWRDSGARGIVILGDAACARRLRSQIGAVGWDPFVVWGLEAAHALSATTDRELRLESARFPLPDTAAMTDQMSDLEKGVEAGESSVELTPRDWYFTLGVDLASLVSQALSGLPETGASDQQEVRRRHDLARDGLSGARSALTSTSERGFDGGRRILRDIVAVGAERGGSDGR